MARPAKRIRTELQILPETSTVLPGIAVLRSGNPYMPIGVLVLDPIEKPDELYIENGEVVFDQVETMISTQGVFSEWRTEFDLLGVLIPAMACNDRKTPHAIVQLPNGTPMYMTISEKSKEKWTASGYRKSRAQREFLYACMQARAKYVPQDDVSVYTKLFEEYVGCNFHQFIDIKSRIERTQSDQEEHKIMADFEHHVVVCETPAPAKRKSKFAPHVDASYAPLDPPDSDIESEEVEDKKAPPDDAEASDAKEPSPSENSSSEESDDEESDLDTF